MEMNDTNRMANIDIELVEKCHDASVKSLTEPDSNGSTLLHRLVNKIEYHATDLKSLLSKYTGIEKKALLAAQDKSKATILHYLAASKNGNQAIAHQTLRNILQESALENNQLQQILMQRNGKGDNILHILAKEAKEDKSLEILEQVIKWYAEAGLKEKLESQGNPMKQAIMNGNTKGAILLMENEYALIFDKNYGLNALHSCIKYMNPELVEYILQKFPDLRTQLDEKKASPLHYVVDLKGPQDSQKQSESLRQRAAILQKLLENDLSDVELLNNQNENCLHLAIGSGFSQAATMIIDFLQKLPMVKQKLKSTRSKEGLTLSQKLTTMLNTKNNDESTPLFLAIQKGFAEVVAKIMRCKGLDGDIRDKQNRTALYIAMDLDQVEAFEKIVEAIPRGLGNPRKRRKLLCYAGEKSEGTKVFKWLLDKVTQDEVKAQVPPASKNQSREKKENQKRQVLKKSSSLPIQTTQDEAKTHELPSSGNETQKKKLEEGMKGKSKKADAKVVFNVAKSFDGQEEIPMHGTQDEDKAQELPSGNETVKKKPKKGKKGNPKEADTKEVLDSEKKLYSQEIPVHSMQNETKPQELQPSGNETLKKKLKEGKKGKPKETDQGKPKEADTKEVFNFEKLLEDQVEVESPMHSVAKSQAEKSWEKYVLLCDRLRNQGKLYVNTYTNFIKPRCIKQRDKLIYFF